MTVVLMHGFGAFMHLLSGVSIKPMVAALTRSGRLVHAPRVQPYNTVPERCERWVEHLREIRKIEKSDLHLIGFSSGGLDARYVISRMGGYEFVRSLTTVSTPHRGASLAEYILEMPPAVRSGVVRLADWMGDRVDGTATSDVHSALEQMTRGYMQDVFNPDVPDHPDVRYQSWAGAAGHGTETPILPALRFSNRVVFEREGPNDGIVSEASARWSGFMGTLDADHARQIGVKAMNGAFEATDFVSGVVDALEAQPPG